MTRVRLTGVVIAALLALPAAAWAIAGVSRPPAGRWKIDAGGGFVVNRARTAVTGFHTSGTACGLAKNVVVKATMKLRTASEGGVTNWVVGYADPQRTSKYDAHGIVGQKVTVHSGAKTVTGRVDIVFAVTGDARRNGGDLIINGCDLFFNAHHL